MARLILSPEARTDIRETIEFIARNNADAARRVRAQIFEQLDALADYPELGRERPEIGSGARALPVGKYLIIYRVADDEVQVARVWHTSQDIRSILNG